MPPILTLSADDYRRLAEVLRVLAQSGARPALTRLGLLRGGSGGKAGNLEEMAEAVVAALERLGPTFVKLGQILATRSDLLSPELTERLARLHDRAAPVPFAELRDQLMQDLGAPPEEVFAAFSPEPLASASIAQVHAAQLRSGEEAVIKMRRPGIEAVMAADLRLLLAAARTVERRVPALARHQPARVVEELRDALMEEIDFRIEARNQEEVRGRSSDFVVPKVYLEYSTAATMVSERVKGESPNVAFRRASPDLARSLAPQAARGLLTMVLIDGVFHADPHPGNVLVTSEGRLALLDFGSVGRLSERRREQVLTVLGSLVDGDAGAISDVLLDWSGRPGAPPPALEVRVERFLSRNSAKSGDTIRLAEAITEFIGIARENELTLPPDLILLLRALGIAEGLARTLDPDLDVIAAIAPVVLRAFSARYGRDALLARGLRTFRELDQVLRTAPEALRRTVASLRRDGLAVQVSLPDLAPLPGAVRHAGETVALALVAAALILSAALSTIDGRLSAAAIIFLIQAGLVLILLCLRMRRRHP